MSGLSLLAEATHDEAPIAKKRQREEPPTTRPQDRSKKKSGTPESGDSNSMFQRNQLFAQQAETNAKLQTLLNERSALLQKQHDLAISASAAIAGAVAPPVPKSLSRDSRGVLRRIFGEHEQNGVLNQQQMRGILATHRRYSSSKEPPKIPPNLFAGAETIDFNQFDGLFQYCKRCTEQKYRKSDVVTTVQEVIVRKMPQEYEGGDFKSCIHFQWMWCPKIDGNWKCQGSNSPKCCPKYLAKSTFWKHRLPPKHLKRQDSVEVVSGGKTTLMNASSFKGKGKERTPENIFIVSKPGVSLSGTFAPTGSVPPAAPGPAPSIRANGAAPSITTNGDREKGLSKLGLLAFTGGDNPVHVCVPNQNSWV